MAVVRCKMCGGTLELNHDETVGICEYCGTRQTLPKLGDEQKANLYERANHLRRNNEYDKAMGIYEQILNADRTDAESYWSLVLCRYGIEYVEDPANHKRIPTVNRAQFTSIFADEDYKSAIYYADALQKEIYEQEAKAIDEIQKGILAISQKEKPFDVFICYKETDSNGRRTPDSVLATDLYHQLKQEGFKVFFSRITLEDKLGVEYEPYIFAALNSAKVMVVLGTKPEYFNAVWVKNEWSRYLALIKNGAKKMLIPAYRDMDPYDLPEEFSHLQAQDMSKLGFMQDLIRGIKKIVSSETDKPAVKETVVISGATSANAAPLLRRVFIFLEDGDFANADEYCEKVLDMEPENAEAYLGKMMAELGIRKREDLSLCEEPFDQNGNYKRALRFADEAFAAELRSYISAINERKENRRLESLYRNCVRVMETSRTEDDYINAAKNFEELGSFGSSAEMANRCRAKAEEAKIAKLDAVYNSCIAKMNSAKTEADYKKATDLFKNISGYRDADEMAMICLENAEKARLQVIYDSAKAKMAENKIKSYEQAIEIFRSISAFEDSENQIYFCQGKIEEIKAKEAEEKIERERKAEQKRIENQRRKENAKRLAKIWSPIIAGVLAFAILLNYAVIPNFEYVKTEINTMVEEAKAEKAEKDAERARKKAEREAAKTEKTEKTEKFDYIGALFEYGSLKNMMVDLVGENYKETVSTIMENEKNIFTVFEKISYINANYNSDDYKTYFYVNDFKNYGVKVADEIWDDLYKKYSGIGSYGENAFWKLSTARSLTINGEGKILSPSSEMEWTKLVSENMSLSIFVKEGITEIGDYVFADICAKSIKIYLPESLETVSPLAFYGNKKVDFEEGVAEKFGIEIESKGFDVGNIITFGSYEQDNNLKNGAEPIEWIVLEKGSDGKEALVISKNVIEARKYSDYSKGKPHYFTPSMQKWLNETFYNKAFNEEEKERILTKETEYEYEYKFNSSVKGSGSVKTKLRFLTLNEFESFKLKAAMTSEYVLNNYELSKYGFTPWGIIGGTAVNARDIGLPSGKNDYIGIRPVMWIEIPEEEHTETVSHSEATVGDVVTFGSYEQDNNLENGKEPIEWQVLDIQDGKALVISKYGLDSKPYNGKYVDVTWETCSLRNWLNSSFINKAFSVEERKMIAKTSLVNPDNPSYKTLGGNNTVDKIFLLSIDEAKEYFSSDAKRQCKPSAYVKENGTYDFWWLRSPAYIQKHAADVGSDSGDIFEYGVSVSNGGGGMVRPAMWVDLSAFEE